MATSFGIQSETSGLRKGRRGLLSPAREGYVHSSGRRAATGAEVEMERREEEDEEDEVEVEGRREAAGEVVDPNESLRAKVGRRGVEEAIDL